MLLLLSKAIPESMRLFLPQLLPSESKQFFLILALTVLQNVAPILFLLSFSQFLNRYSKLHSSVLPSFWFLHLHSCCALCLFLPPSLNAIPSMDSLRPQLDSFPIWNPQAIGFLPFQWECLHSRLYFFCTYVLSSNSSSLKMEVKFYLFLKSPKKPSPGAFS